MNHVCRKFVGGRSMIWPRATGFYGVLLAAVVYLSGCTPTDSNASKTQVKVYSSETSKTGLQGIVTLGAGVTETVFALGFGDEVVGVDVSSLYPPETDDKKKVDYVRKTSAEGIASLRPKLVIAPPYIGPDTVPDQLRKLGIDVQLVPKAKSLAGAYARIKAVGEILGRTEEAEAMIGGIKGKVIAAEDHVQGRSKVKVLMVWVHGGKAMQVAGSNTKADVMIRAAGGENAFAEIKGHKAISAEALISAQPDVVLATTRSLKSMGGEEGLWASPGLMKTPAGQSKRIVIIDDLKLLGFGPRTGKAILELAQKFYP